MIGIPNEAEANMKATSICRKQRIRRKNIWNLKAGSSLRILLMSGKV